jgi:hypothetical protein
MEGLLFKRSNIAEMPSRMETHRSFDQASRKSFSRVSVVKTVVGWCESVNRERLDIKERRYLYSNSGKNIREKQESTNRESVLERIKNPNIGKKQVSTGENL